MLSHRINTSRINGSVGGLGEQEEASKTAWNSVLPKQSAGHSPARMNAQPLKNAAAESRNQLEYAILVDFYWS